MKMKGLAWYSCGASLPSRAFLARALVSAEMLARPFEPASLIIGVINPFGVATATEISVFLYLEAEVIIQRYCIEEKKKRGFLTVE
jgi:hypothetical protein